MALFRAKILLGMSARTRASCLGGARGFGHLAFKVFQDGTVCRFPVGAIYQKTDHF